MKRYALRYIYTKTHKAIKVVGACGRATGLLQRHLIYIETTQRYITVEKLEQLKNVIKLISR